MLTILEESEFGGTLRKFRTIRWNSSNILPNTATKTFWQVDTLQRKFNFIEYMKMKMLLSNLSLLEYRCFVDAPGVLTDNLFMDAVLAFRMDLDKDLLMQRLNILQNLMGRREWNTNLFYTLSGVIKYRIQECRKAIRPADKYSGYVRNSSSVGSKHFSNITIPIPETFEWNQYEQIDFLRFLTVGELTSGSPGGNLFTLTRTKSPKR